MNASIENYLKVYNTAEALSWFTALLFLPFNPMVSFYLIIAAQTLALSEVFYAWKKWSNSTPFYCFIQSTARLLILFFSYLLLFISIFKPIQWLMPTVLIMLTVWCIAETTRYVFYISQLFKYKNTIITWLRYTLFIICYPVGIVCEFFILFTVFRYNDVLGVKIAIIALGVIYLIYFPKLFMHLLNQRKHKLF